MSLNELHEKILEAIDSNLSHKDLLSLFDENDKPTSELKKDLKEQLETYTKNQSYFELKLISDKIDAYMTISSKHSTIIDDVLQDSPQSLYIPEILSDVLLSQAPINLEEEVTGIDRNAVAVLNILNYSNAMTTAPTKVGNVYNSRLPNMLPHVPVQISPFYCCPVCVHPMSLLVPQTMPNIPQINRIISHSTIHFTLSDDAQKLISRNSQNIDNKMNYKWQVLLRFVAVNPKWPLPTQGQSVSEVLPPYLTVSVNTESKTLWDLLPSSCRAKEGKRHPNPVNISDKLSNNRSSLGYEQTIDLTWWQTPEVFQYYYVGVYLERRLSECEIHDLLISSRHINTSLIEDSMMLIKSRLSEAMYRNDNDDDELTVLPILPISLSCPVGGGRIEVPIRALQCRHLQCYDARAYLSMNARRSTWKCPVCGTDAALDQLFCDKFFQLILQQFKDNEDVDDINVNADGTCVAVIRSKKKDRANSEPDTDKI